MKRDEKKMGRVVRSLQMGVEQSKFVKTADCSIIFTNGRTADNGQEYEVTEK